MKITAQDLIQFGVIDGVIPEPLGGAHRDPAATIASAGRAVSDALRSLHEIWVRTNFAMRARKSIWRWAEDLAPFLLTGGKKSHCDRMLRRGRRFGPDDPWPDNLRQAGAVEIVSALHRNKPGPGLERGRSR